MAVAPAVKIKTSVMENKEIEVRLINREGKPSGREIVRLEHIISWGEWTVYPVEQSSAPLKKATKLSLSNGRSLYVDMLLDEFINLKNEVKNGNESKKQSTADNGSAGKDKW